MKRKQLKAIIEELRLRIADREVELALMGIRAVSADTERFLEGDKAYAQK